jgi:histidine ammonia-lyase
VAQHVLLDGATLTPAAVARVARDGAPVRIAAAARERNAAAARAVAALLERGDPLYGATTGVGALSGRRLEAAELAGNSLRLLRSHAAGGGALLPAEQVRAAMAVRANQIGAGGAGIAPPLLEALAGALNAGATPAVHELGSLGTGDVCALAEIALALLGEEVIELGPRDGLAFMSSNAVSVGAGALLVVDVRRLLDAWLAVAALSFEAIGADPVVLDERLHAARGGGQAAVAARMRALLDGFERPSGGRVQDAYPFRVLPSVDGVAHDALEALERVVAIELNLAGENALVLVDAPLALPNGNFHTARLAGALDGLRGALAQSGALIAARVSALLDPACSGLPAFLAARPGPDSGAMMLEYTAHGAVAEVRSLAAPLSVATTTVAQGIESHASFAPTAARRARDALAALRVAVAVELVVGVRALRMSGREPRGAQTRALAAAAGALLSAELDDRPLHPDIDAAQALIARWPLADA